jgi:hypothetical protein
MIVVFSNAQKKYVHGWALLNKRIFFSGGEYKLHLLTISRHKILRRYETFPKDSVLDGSFGTEQSLGRHGLDWYGSVQGQVAGSCEWGNKPLEFHELRGIYWHAEELLNSQGLCSMEWVKLVS